MRRPRLALVLGRTLKIENETLGLGWDGAPDVIPEPDCGITCSEEGCGVCTFIEPVCISGFSCVCVSVC